MTSKERIKLALEHKEADRIALSDSPWATTITRWHEEGLPEGTGPGEYFKYEMTGAGSDTTLRLPTDTVEDTDEYTIVRNANGALVKNWKRATSTPEMIDFTIRTREDWDQHKKRYQDMEGRVDVEALRKAMEGTEKTGHWFSFTNAFGYDKTQGIVGSVNLLTAMMDDPDWVADMFMASAELVVKTGNIAIDAGIKFDGVFMYDDMGYRNATLFSPRAYKELLWPTHKRVCDFAKDHGLPVILHTCGHVMPLIPDLIEAGFTCVQPLEVKAGMDLLKLKREVGDKLAFMGGVDVRAMAAGGEALDEEVQVKILCGKQGGGYIYHSDHSVPDNVSFDNYCRVIELVNEYGRY